MATAAVTHTFTAGTSIQSVQANTNFTDIVTFLNNNVAHTDASKTFTGTQAFASLSFTGTVGAAAGSAAAPAYTFTDDPDTGIYRSGADTLAFSTGGTLAGEIDSSGRIRWDNAIIGPVGSAAAPALSFETDSDTGFYRSGTNTIAWTSGGTAGGYLLDKGIRALDGSVSEPSLSFFNDSDTGIWRFGADNMRFTAGGASQMAITSSGVSLIGTAIATNVTVTRNGSSGLLTVVSSSRDTKENINDWDDSEWLYDLRPVTYEYTGSGWKQIGFIAEEVTDVASEAGVHWDGPGQGKIADFDNRAVLAACVSEIQKLKELVDAS